jgi:hypothetical protein
LFEEKYIYFVNICYTILIFIALRGKLININTLFYSIWLRATLNNAIWRMGIDGARFMYASTEDEDINEQRGKSLKGLHSLVE